MGRRRVCGEEDSLGLSFNQSHWTIAGVVEIITRTLMDLSQILDWSQGARSNRSRMSHRDMCCNWKE